MVGNGVVARVLGGVFAGVHRTVRPNERIASGGVNVAHDEDLVDSHVVATVGVGSSVGFHRLPEGVALGLVLGSGFVVVHLHGVLQRGLRVGDDDVLDHRLGGCVVAGLVASLEGCKSVDHGLLAGSEGVGNTVGFRAVVSSALLHGVSRGARPVLVRSVEESPAFVPVVRSTRVVVGVACVGLGHSSVELVDGVADHAHVGGQLGDALVSNGVRSTGEVTGTFHGRHDVGANGAVLSVERVVVVVLARCGSEPGERAVGTVALLSVLPVGVDVLCFIPVAVGCSGLDVAEILHQRAVVVHVRCVRVARIGCVEEGGFLFLRSVACFVFCADASRHGGDQHQQC